MIALALFSIAVILWRLKWRRASRAEVLLAGLVLMNFLVVFAQEKFGGVHPFPEARYYNQTYLLLYPWGIWGVLQLMSKVKRINARICLGVVFGVFAIYDGVMLIKAHLPVGRRSAYEASIQWALPKIAADWQGPKRDELSVMNGKDYHTPYRPVVAAHSARLPYLLGGRDSIFWAYEKEDVADYWFSDIRRDEPPAKGYDLMDEFKQGKYTFQLYRRKRKGVSNGH